MLTSSNAPTYLYLYHVSYFLTNTEKVIDRTRSEIDYAKMCSMSRTTLDEYLKVIVEG